MRDMDPRVKLSAVMMLTAAVFFVDKISVCVCMALTVFFMRIVLRIPFRNLKLLKNLSLLAVFIILAQTVFGPGDKYIFPSIWGGILKWDGLFLGLVITCRLFTLMMVFPLLSETTTGEKLSAGICAIGVQYRIAYIITSAFNQVPRFAEEARLIIDAQKLRCADYFEKKGRSPVISFKKINAYAKICLPLILNAMRKAQVSSVAMDSRAFGVYKTRTWIDKPKMKTKDFLFMFGCMVFSALILILNYIIM